MSSTASCFNRECREPKSERRRKGWRLRSGHYSELCDRCASAFEEGKFCDTFHQHAAGWRSCESCSKPVHCGCIASAHTFVLLDAGGINCIHCAMKTSILTQNPAWPSLLSPPMSVANQLKDPSVRNWNHKGATGSVGSLWQATDVFSSSAQTEQQPRRSCLGDISDGTGFNHEDKQSVCMRSSVPAIVKDEPPAMHYALASASRNETEDRARASISQQQSISPIGNMLSSTSNNELDSSGQTHLRNTNVRVDMRSRNQLLSRYCPKISDQELQQISGDSNAAITPLFEKMLSASDAGRVGRLVLPKKCAETYFPPISEPEGLPLRVQDVKGQEWIFQFRYWPNNNSRMYVLEGITPCIQSMELQAGDTVTFSRLEPEGKLIMGYRKAASVPMCNQTQPLRPCNGIPAQNNVNIADPVSLWSKVDKSGYVAKEALRAKTSLNKRKNGRVSSKNKRVKLDTIGLIELKVTLEEAQGLLRPHVDHIPKVVLVEDFEFEEYKDAPVIGRPSIITKASVGEGVQWVQCDSCSKWRRIPSDALPPAGWTCFDNSWDRERSSCLVAQELSTEQLDNLLNTMDPAKCKQQKAFKPDTDPCKASDDSPGTTITKTSLGSLCIAKEELSIEQLQNLLCAPSSDASTKSKAAKLDPYPAEVLDELGTFGNFAIVGEGETVSTSAQATTRHPRHRPGCTCIVCIQPPSGKGPKHMPTCICSVCVTVRRRFRTMMLRRERKKSEIEAETVQPDTAVNTSWTSDKAEPAAIDLLRSSDLGCSSPDRKTVNIEGSDEVPSKKSSASPSKGQIDLNIQPEREEELSPRSNPGNMNEMFDGTIERTSKMLNEVVDLERSKLHNVPLENANPGGDQMEPCNKPNICASLRNGEKEGAMDNPAMFSTNKATSALSMG